MDEQWTGGAVDRTNEEWLADLHAGGEQNEQALIDLGRILRRGLPYALSGWLSPSDPNFEPLVDDVVQETLLKVLDRLDSFEGRSKFSTWVQKIAVRVALTELRRKRWGDQSLDEIIENVSGNVKLVADQEAAPERTSLQSDMLERIQHIIEGELTEKQRSALVALGIHGMSAQEVARRMGMNRNALYKLMHDARRRMKERLAQEELNVADVLDAFSGD